MKRDQAVVLLVVLGLIGSGCASGRGTGTADPQTLAHQRLVPPSMIALPTALDATTTPRPLVGQPSLRLTAEDATAGQSRAAAEQFALEAAHVLTDVRPGLSGELALGSLASSSMPAGTRAYLVADMDDQHKMGFERHLDTGLEMWIRSMPDGRAAAPRSVTVELAVNIVAAVNFTGAPGGFHFWYRMRLVVVREGSRWRLAGYSDGPSGPKSRSNLTPGQQREFLVGTGWRRIPAS